LELKKKVNSDGLLDITSLFEDWKLQYEQFSSSTNEFPSSELISWLEQDILIQFNHDEIVKLWCLMYQEYPSLPKYRRITLVLNKLRLGALMKEFPDSYSKRKIKLPLQIENSLKNVERNNKNSKSSTKTATTTKSLISKHDEVFLFL